MVSLLLLVLLIGTDSAVVVVVEVVMVVGQSRGSSRMHICSPIKQDMLDAIADSYHNVRRKRVVAIVADGAVVAVAVAAAVAVAVADAAAAAVAVAAQRNKQQANCKIDKNQVLLGKTLDR